MVSPENTNWLFDYGLMEDIAVPASGFSWPVQPLDGSSNVGYGYFVVVEILCCQLALTEIRSNE